jgi:hypothetical protein
MTSDVNESRDINHSIHSRLSSMRGRRGRDLQLSQYAISKNVCSFFKVQRIAFLTVEI